MNWRIIYTLIYLLHNFILGTLGNVRLTVEVDTDDGNYRIKVDQDTWLVGAPPFFIIDGIRYSLDEGNLEFQNVTESYGFGPGLLGTYSAYDIHYKANETNIMATVKYYASPNLLFQVQYVDGGNNTRGYNEWETICGFPGFEMDSDLQALGYLTFSSRNIDTIVAGRWNKTAFIPDSLEGSGPVALFDHTGRTIVISQADNFMTASSWRDKTNNRLYWGIMGGVDHMPVNFTYQTILTFDSSIRKGFSSWGFFLSNFIYYINTAVTPRYRNADISRQYIGYWTSPGSAYHDSPGSGKTYEQIIHDVILDSQKNDFKYRYVQLDDWWYVKSNDGKIMEWSPSASKLPHGLQTLHNSSNVQFLAYAGMWAADNVYINGSEIDSDFVVENGIALPISQAFWDQIFQTTKSWGITSYEQDKLSDTFLSMNSTTTDLYLASNWLSHMSSAAYRNNITILYNDACPRHILHSLVTPAVTQISISNDPEQSALGVRALFVGSLAIAPYKGVFRTRHGNGNVANPALQEVVAILTGGSVGVGDSVGSSDYGLLKRLREFIYKVNMSDNISPARYPYLPISDINLHSSDTEDEIIERYFKLGFSYAEIIGFLQLHGVRISYRHNQRKLHNMGLKRRNEKTDWNKIIRAVEHEITGIGKNIGYRTMHQRICQYHTLNASKECVRVIMSHIDPEGVNLRRKHKLHRRLYNVRGPNYLWHLDGWDKLKPFGLCVHACIDGFSRRLMWLEACPSNKNPFVICSMFVDCIKTVNGIPHTIRADRGTENVNIEILQSALSSLSGTSTIPFLYGKSTANQRIESFWSKMTLYGLNTWIEHFKQLSGAGVVDNSKELHIQCILYCYMPLLRTELNTIFQLWNTHFIRKSLKTKTPHGRPDVMFFMPELFGGINSLQNINANQLNNLAESLTYKTPDCKEVYWELFTSVVTENHLSVPQTLTEADDLLVTLLDNIETELE